MYDSFIIQTVKHVYNYKKGLIKEKDIDCFLYYDFIDKETIEEIIKTIEKEGFNKKKDLNRKRKENKKRKDKENNSKREKYKNITKEKKLSLRKTALDKNKLKQNLKTLTSIISYKDINIPKNFDNIDKFKEFLITNDFYNLDIDKCVFEKDNEVYISKDGDTGRVYYFSRDNEREEFFYLDILDFYMILLDKSCYRAIYEIAKELEVEFIGKEYYEMCEKKSINNLIKITEIAENKEKYSYLYKLIRRHLGIFTILQGVDMDNITIVENSYNSKSVFFISQQKLAELIGKGSSSAGRSIYLLLLLKLLVKVEEKDIPSTMYVEAIRRKKPKHFLQSFYVIPELTEESLEEAEEIAKTMSEQGLQTRDFSKKKIEEVFGKEGINRVYGDNLKKMSIIEKKKKEIEVNSKENNENEEDRLNRIPF